MLYRNRFIDKTYNFVVARRRARTEATTERVLGFMITNFNAISCETSSALEMMLDWCHSFSNVSLQPKAVLKQLLEGVPVEIVVQVDMGRRSEVPGRCVCMHVLQGATVCGWPVLGVANYWGAGK